MEVQILPDLFQLEIALTMGEQSSSVFDSGQNYSFGNIIAKQVGTTYAQAIFSDPGTGEDWRLTVRFS